MTRVKNLAVAAVSVGVLAVALTPSGWAADPKPKETPKAKVSATPTPKPPPEPKLPQVDVSLKGKFLGTVDNRRFEQTFNVRTKTGEKVVVHCTESGLTVDLALLPKATRLDDNKDALLLDLFLHCNTNKRHLQRHAEVLVDPASSPPIELNNKTDKDKFSVEVVVTPGATPTK